MFILLLVAVSVSLTLEVLAINATGSTYTIGQFSATTANGNVNGTEYSGSASSILGAITDDAQGLQSGAVVGISGSAILVQNKTPIINSYNIFPVSVNQSSMVRIFISAVYTNQVLVNIIRPDDVVDEIDMSSQSVYYYPDTDVLGRYTVMFNAIGNTVVNAEDYFDVVENVPPSEPPTTKKTSRSTGGSQSTSNQNRIYLSVSRFCTDNPGITVEVANDNDVVPYALITVESADKDNKDSISSNLSLNSTSDEYGLAVFDLPPGNYTIVASASNQGTVTRHYELYCQEVIRTNESVEENNSITPITGQATQTASDSESIRDISIQETSAQQLTIFTHAFLAYLTFTSLVFIFSLIVLLKLYRKESDLGVSKGKEPTTIVFVDNVHAVKEQLTPVEEAIIKIEEELREVSQENKKKEMTDVSIKGISDVVEKKETEKIKEIKETQKGAQEEIQKEAPKEVKKEEKVKSTETREAPKTPIKPRKEISVAFLPKKMHPYMQNVREGSEFILQNGEHISNLQGLLVQMKRMGDDVFKYHVTDYKNDFATWIYNAIGYKELAELIGPIKSQKKMIEMIEYKIDIIKSLS